MAYATPPAGIGSQKETRRYARVATAACRRSHTGKHEQSREPCLDEAEPARRQGNQGEEGGPDEREQDERGIRLGVDGPQAGDERDVLVDPLSCRSDDRSLPTTAERPPKRIALAQQAIGKIVHWATSANRAVEGTADCPADEDERLIPDEDCDTGPEGEDEDCRSQSCRLRETALDRSPGQDRREAEERERKHGAEEEQGNAGQRRRDPPRRKARSREHAELEGASRRSPTRDDAAEPVSRELGQRDGKPGPRLESDALKLPDRNEGQRLGAQRDGDPFRREIDELCARK